MIGAMRCKGWTDASDGQLRLAYAAGRTRERQDDGRLQQLRSVPGGIEVPLKLLQEAPAGTLLVATYGDWGTVSWRRRPHGFWTGRCSTGRIIALPAHLLIRSALVLLYAEPVSLDAAEAMIKEGRAS